MRSEERKVQPTELPGRLALPLLALGAMVIAIGASFGDAESTVGFGSLLLLVALFVTGLVRQSTVATEPS